MVSHPIAPKTYRYPKALKSEIDSQINRMLEQGVIKKSPVWVVPKKTRRLGRKKIQDCYRLP